MYIKVGIDVTPILNRVSRGIGNYVLELIKYMKGVNYVYLYKISRIKYPKRLRRLQGIGYPFFEVLGVPVFPMNFQIFHGTDGYIPKTDKFKKILTVHDVYNVINYPENRFSSKLRRSLERSPDGIISVSEFVKKEFLKIFPEFEEKVFVVHHGVSEFWKNVRSDSKCQYLLNELNIKKPYFFTIFVYSGLVDKRKNLENLLIAFSQLKSDVLLVISGGNINSYYVDIIKKNKLEDRIIITGYVDSGMLRCLYSSAVAFVYVSLYEGFGLPILEAMKCGTPVVASNIEVFREVAGEAFIKVEPLSPSGIAEGLRRSFDPVERRKYIELGLQVSNKFSWLKTAYETKKVYMKVLKL